MAHSQQVKFDKGNVLLPATVALEGENGGREHVSATSTAVPITATPPKDASVTSTGTNEHEAPRTSEAESPLLVQDPLGTSFVRDPEPEPSTQTTTGPQRSRKPSAYVQQIQSGEAVTHNIRRYTGIPKGLQMPAPIHEESTDAAEIKFALAAAASDAEGMDPLTLDEARNRSDWPKWDQAIQTELGALEKAGTWRVVERPKDRNVVNCKWVFRMKKNSNGQIEKYKARLVAKGFTQVEGVDYFETFAPVAKLASIWSILAIASRNDWPIDMFDFHSAFLNGEHGDDEEVFMEQPLGYEERDWKCFCVQLLKSIYSLKQAGRKWYEVVCKLMGDLGFHRSEADPAVYYSHQDGHILVIAIHVDDCTITGDSQERVDKCKKAIKARFSLTDLGPASWLLGIKII